MESLQTLPGISNYYYFNKSASSVDRICVCVCARPAHLLGYGKCVSLCVLYSSVGGFPCERSRGGGAVGVLRFLPSSSNASAVRTTPHAQEHSKPAEHTSHLHTFRKPPWLLQQSTRCCQVSALGSVFSCFVHVGGALHTNLQSLEKNTQQRANQRAGASPGDPW